MSESIQTSLAKMLSDPTTATRAKKTFEEVEAFLDRDEYLSHALEYDDEAMFDCASPGRVHYVSRDDQLRVAVESLGEHQVAVEMSNDETGAHSEETYGAAEAERLVGDLTGFYGLDRD